MAIYVIGDLHLSFETNKPMNIFGENWEKHTEKIEKNWNEKVEKDDTIIIAGDFSWAMNLQETYKDFEFINNFNGRKIILKGNHDYWWTTITNMKNFLNENGFYKIDFLHNNSYFIENKIIVGTRGWALNDTENSNKMIKREALRLELSIKSGVEQYGKDKEIIVIMHYPPLVKTKMKNEYTYDSEFLNIMKKYNIKKCYYGHLHGDSHKDAVEGKIEGIEFKLISGDYLDFKLYKIVDN